MAVFKFSVLATEQLAVLMIGLFPSRSRYAAALIQKRNVNEIEKYVSYVAFKNCIRL